MKRWALAYALATFCYLWSTPQQPLSTLPLSKNIPKSTKKVLFIMPEFLLGGTEWAFLNMINSIDSLPISYEICIVKRGGILEQFLKPDSKIISWREACSSSYDIAISYAHKIPPPMWVDQIKASRKIQWIHTDLKGAGWTPQLEEAWFKVDHYVLVSQKSKESFDEVCPSLASKSCVVHNFIDNDRIRKEATKRIYDMPTEDKLLNVVSICRLDWIKGLDRAIRVTKRLNDEGLFFRWYVVGEGRERENLEKLINKYHLQDTFILLGSRLNPYPYLRKADIFVLPSRSEAFPLACIEAKILARPILITKVSGAKELISSGTNGLIVTNNDQGIYEGLKRLLSHQKLRKKFSRNLQGFDYDNSSSLEELRIILCHNEKT
jgi:glycosyltransferase involved in cell wall biosynthesis